MVITDQNTTGQSQYVPINATAANGFFVTAWVFVQPAFLSPPTLMSGPTLGGPSNGTLTANYKLNLTAGRADQSITTWYSCDDASGSNPRAVAVNRGNVSLRTYTLVPGNTGKYLRAGVQPKVDISDPGPEVFAISSRPIAASDIKSTTVSPDFTNFVTTANRAGMYWSGTVPAGNSNVYSMFKMSYAGTIQLSTTATLARAGSGYQATVTVKNSGTSIAQNVELDTATLGSASGVALPVLLGSIAPGGSATATITYPSPAGVSGTSTVSKYAGGYTGGSFTASVRATLP